MQTTKSRLVLSQYREGSEYADKVGVQYHFPRKYYNLLTLPDIEFIYYEPKKKGEGVYFGYGEVGRVDPDPNDPEQFFAEILSYRPLVIQSWPPTNREKPANRIFSKMRRWPYGRSTRKSLRISVSKVASSWRHLVLTAKTPTAMTPLKILLTHQKSK